MNGKYPWSESGLQLLQTIKSYIEQNGGRISLANSIMREDKKAFKKQLDEERRSAMPIRERFKFTPEADQIIRDNWNCKTLKEIKNLIGYTHHWSVVTRAHELGLGERARFTYRDGQKPKPVIIKFGDYEKRCNSITSAAAELGCRSAYILKAIHKDYHVSGAKVRFA